MSVHSCLVLCILATLCIVADSTYIKVKPCDGETVEKKCSTWTFSRVTCKVEEGKIQDVQLIKDESGGFCKHGSWGYDTSSNTIWVDDCCRARFKVCLKDSCDGKIIDKYCETWTNKRVTCKVDEGTVTSVKLFKDKSGGYCEDKNSWGYDQNSVWVDDCCMAQFKVCVKEKTKCEGDLVYKKCESWNGRATACYYDVYAIKSVKIYKEESENICEEGVNWFHGKKYVEVKANCRATFEICPEVPKKCDGDVIYRKCESWQYKYAKCEYKDGTIKSVDLEKQESKTKCVKNENWGYNKNSIWVNKGCRAKFWLCVEADKVCKGDLVYKTCSGLGLKRQECKYTDSRIKHVKMYKELTKNICEKNENWGYSQTYVWVDQACKAKFELCVEEDRKCDFDKDYKKCESWNYKYAKCEYKDGIIKKVKVQERYSDAKCVENESWGYKDDYIWVKAGCRAKFWLCVEKKTGCDAKKNPCLPGYKCEDSKSKGYCCIPDKSYYR